MTRIEFAPDELIARFEAGGQRFGQLVGVQHFLATNKTQLRDFALDSKQRRALTLALGYIPHDDQLLWKVFRDLEA